MLQSVKEDIFRYQGDNYKRLSVRLSYLYKPYTRFMCYFRHHQEARNPLLKLFWKVLCTRQKYKSAVQIPCGTKVGKGLRLVHFGCVVVHPDAVIGDNCNIAQGVLIGESFNKGIAGVPTIGNNCCLFANSMILGGVKLGDNVLVAPGAFVNFDVPDNSIVVGNPGRIIRRDVSPTAKYIVYPIEKLK